MAQTNYVLSSDILVFPAGFRGQNFITGKALSEQALTSLRSLSNISINNNFFVEDVDDPNYCLIGINGYVFKLLKTKIPTASGDMYAYIRLRSIGSSDVGISQKIGYVLDNISRQVVSQVNDDSQYTLDQIPQGETNYYFQGLYFSVLQPASSDMIKYIKIREGEGGNFIYTRFRLSAREIRDEIYTPASSGVAESYEATTDDIAKKLHTNNLIAQSAQLVNLTATSTTITDLTTTKLNNRKISDIFEDSSTRVKLASYANNININSVGVVTQNGLTTSIISGVAGTGKKFLTVTDNNSPELSVIQSTDIPIIEENQVNGLITDLNSKLNSANSVATNLTANGLTTSGTLTVNEKLIGGSSLVGTQLPASGQIGQIFFYISDIQE